MIAGKDYIKLDDEGLNKLQSEISVILEEFDRICKKNNIPYFLSHGTLLGAVRHKGFIPWDDDIDVQMLRSDYDKLCEIIKKDLDEERFLFQTQKTDKHYNWVYGKLRLKNTSYVRTGQEHIKQQDGIFMDIFPLDVITENKFKQKLVSKICTICRKILWSQVGKKHAATGLLKCMYFVVSFIPRDIVIHVNDYFAQYYNKRKSSLLVCHNLKGEIFKKSWFQQNAEINFCGKKFSAPKKYHEILSQIYGDYMTLPEKEKRQGHCYASYIKFSDGIELKL
ncbi:LicD family protein [Paenibacillus illinoisensis]|uniref:LicD family protein n=1 Tax=Paenibacillus illinoisensis TaxID=59845 RepID=UPI0034B9D664